MANGHGGRREGAGRKHQSLHDICDYRKLPSGEQQPVTVMERLEEAIRAGGFLHDAAARVGITVETLRDWRKQGVKAARDVANGHRRRSELRKHEIEYAELAARLERAESDARLQLLAVGRNLALGGIETRKTVRRRTIPRRGQAAVIEETEETAATLPDGAMVRWLLSHRWPEDFAGRVELTGPHGGPMQVDTTPALEKLRDILNQTAENNTKTPIETPVHDTNGHQPTTT